MRRDGVLLLGGAGFIGGALSRRLVRDELPMHIVGRDQEDQLEHVLPQCGTVVHLACSTTPGASAASSSLEPGNLGLTLRLLDLLKNRPETHLIFSSSGGTVYGGRALHSICRPARGIDVRNVVLDSSRLHARLGWRPAAGLEDGVARIWNWLQRHG